MSEQPRGLSRIPFTRTDEDRIGELSRWMHLYGLLILVAAVYMTVLFITNAMSQRVHWAMLMEVLLAGMIAYWALSGAFAFQKVVTSDTSDQEHLVTGLRKLRSLILLKAIFMLIGIVMPAVVLLTAIVLGAIKGN